ncbi:MAG: inositol-3-phosphate synthase [Planctomycetes bacterium]|nr:inositol-3-phosphate synthase [Planctomycetota bacterium]
MVGARGSISTCLLYGLHGLREGLLEPLGLVTELAPFTELGLRPFEEIVLGGHDVCTRSLSQSARELVEHGILKSSLVETCARPAASFEARLRPGPLDTPDVGMADLDPRSARLGGCSSREQVEAIEADLEEFRTREGLERVIVVNLASTEAWREEPPEWQSLAAFEKALEDGRPQPASMLYAYAALRSGCPYVNFTPSLGASSPALRELARKKKVPHCGSDGKTGETLVKTVLAPMFAARHLRVLAWQGYNMLGNRDGEVLADGAHRLSKVRNKSQALRALLGDENVHTHVGIDYVPSLQDWKTAWDFIHFEGFLGARMTLQFTWSASDSALAAPLVLDLVRLADLAHARGEVGEMTHTACFFKAPIAGGTHDFLEQHRNLLEYVRTHTRGRPRR